MIKTDLIEISVSKKKLDNLLWEYKELFWTAYYMVHPLSFEEEKKVSQFINNLLE